MSKLSDVFKRVKQDIEDDKGSYICILLDSYERTGVKSASIIKAMRVIEERLAGTYSYETWVDQHHPKIYRKYRPGSPEWSIMRKKSRTNWLDSLLKEFE